MVRDRGYGVMAMAYQDPEKAGYPSEDTSSSPVHDTTKTKPRHGQDSHSDDGDDESSSAASAPPSPRQTNASLSRTVSEVRDGIQNQRELEEGGPSNGKREDEAVDGVERDENLVDWDGPDDPKNPKNWALKRKWAAVVTGGLLLAPLTM